MESIQKGTLNRNFNHADSSSCCVCRKIVLKGTPTTVPNNCGVKMLILICNKMKASLSCLSLNPDSLCLNYWMA